MDLLVFLWGFLAGIGAFLLFFLLQFFTIKNIKKCWAKFKNRKRLKDYTVS